MNNETPKFDFFKLVFALLLLVGIISFCIIGISIILQTLIN